VAGAAPTAHLIEELEKIGIDPIHVYGLTYVFAKGIRIYIHNGPTEKSVFMKMKLTIAND